MILISRAPEWRWCPLWDSNRKASYTYRWLTWGLFQVTMVNDRMSAIIQQQVREAIDKSLKGG